MSMQRAMQIFLAVVLTSGLVALTPTSAQALSGNKWCKACEGDACITAMRVPKWKVTFLIRIDPAVRQPILAAAQWWPDADLMPGMTWQIDGGKKLNVPYIQCNEARCAAQVEINEAYLDKLRGGGKYRLGATRGGAYHVIDLSLKGFGAAYDGPATVSVDELAAFIK